MAAPDPSNVVDVAVKGFTWGAAGTWSLFLLVLGGFAGLFRAIGPAKLYELWSNRDDKLRGEKRDDEMSDAKQIAVLNDKMGRMTGAFAFLANAVTVAVGALSSDDHETRERAASQSRELVAMAVSTLGNEDPFVKALDRVASVPPVDRKGDKV